MKPNTNQSGRTEGRVGKRFKNACLAGCQQILAQITTVKEAIFAESRRRLGSRAQMLRLALNEAEALAWQTKYPHLVFPTLALEKVQEIVAWNNHQQSVRRVDSASVLAA